LQLGFSPEVRDDSARPGWELGVTSAAYEREKEFMRRDLFMGRLNPEKFSQRLQDLNRYLDYIPF
jgi:hypothetical protein